MLSREDVAARVRQERERLGMNQSDFGAKGGVSRRTQAAYESGTTSPDIAYLSAIAGIGVDVGFILGGNPAVAISAEESELLRRFRAASQEVRAVVMAALSASAGTQAKGDVTVTGDVAQLVSGDQYTKTLSIKTGSRRQKK